MSGGMCNKNKYAANKNVAATKSRNLESRISQPQSFRIENSDWPRSRSRSCRVMSWRYHVTSSFTSVQQTADHGFSILHQKW